MPRDGVWTEFGSVPDGIFQQWERECTKLEGVTTRHHCRRRTSIAADPALGVIYLFLSFLELFQLLQEAFLPLRQTLFFRLQKHPPACPPMAIQLTLEQFLPAFSLDEGVGGRNLGGLGWLLTGAHICGSDVRITVLEVMFFTYLGHWPLSIRLFERRTLF